MHSRQLLAHFLFGRNVERIVFGLPHRVVGGDRLGVPSQLRREHSFNLDGRPLFPNLHEVAQISGFGNPDQPVDVVRHVNVEVTYAAAFATIPSRWRDVMDDDRF